MIIWTSHAVFIKALHGAAANKLAHKYNTRSWLAEVVPNNLIKDLNKSITNIEYNFLNLPCKVTFFDGSTITYLYSADGKKLRTVHKTGSTTTTTDYCDNVVYENGTPKLLLTEEGYVSLNDKKYHYYLKDHQGNNRVVVNESGTAEETNHYYPFGGVFASTGNVQAYKYNGKELDAKKGLNWYDYGARHYDAALGRWHVIDPMAEKYYGISPYTYCNNSPVKHIDPDGRWFWTAFGAAPASKSKQSQLNNAEMNAKQARAKQVGSQMLNSTIGQINPNAVEQIITNGFSSLDLNIDWNEKK